MPTAHWAVLGVCLVALMTPSLLAPLGRKAELRSEAKANLLLLHYAIRVNDGECQSTDLLGIGFNYDRFIPDSALRYEEPSGALRASLARWLPLEERRAKWSREPRLSAASANEPHFLYGFCTARDQHGRIHTADPEVVETGGYSTRFTEALGNPCVRLEALGFPRSRFAMPKICPAEFEVFAIGNLDGDADLEVWSITEGNGHTIVAATPTRLLAD